MTKPTLVITCVHMLHFTRCYKDTLKGDWWYWCHFVPNLLWYMCTNNYSNIERFDKVIAKIKWCSFCLTVYIHSQCEPITVQPNFMAHSVYIFINTFTHLYNLYSTFIFMTISGVLLKVPRAQKICFKISEGNAATDLTWDHSSIPDSSKGHFCNSERINISLCLLKLSQ